MQNKWRATQGLALGIDTRCWAIGVELDHRLVMLGPFYVEWGR